jgi:hypothetical protein
VSSHKVARWQGAAPAPGSSLPEGDRDGDRNREREVNRETGKAQPEGQAGGSARGRGPVTAVSCLASGETPGLWGHAGQA